MYMNSVNTNVYIAFYFVTQNSALLVEKMMQENPENHECVKFVNHINNMKIYKTDL